MNDERYEDSYLYRLRHSAAHLMAQALTELYPGIKLAIGPPIENGFYYDVDPPEPIREEDLKKIEERMRFLAKLGQPIERQPAEDRAEAKQQIESGGDTEYKLQLLADIPEGEEVSFYEQQGTDKQGSEHRFVDLCRGPHVESTAEIKHFKLMSIAGAYWRGDSRNKQLTRIYGTAFESKGDLAGHLHMLEEAKKRDHRILGRELGLFMFSETVGSGLPLWLPKGAAMRDVLIAFMQGEQLRRGYKPVVTPHIGSLRLYEKSGHVQTYGDKMFPFMEDAEKGVFILKPMNCPFHIEIYDATLHSYRDLPVRLAEFGTVYRYEQSGEVAGMFRVRGFTQDDAHLFVTPEQLLDEFKDVVDLMKFTLRRLGLTDFRFRIGTRDDESDKYVGHIDNWRHAEDAIQRACDEMGLDYEVSPGDAAFYGPKLDLIVRDALGREWQKGTVQVDYNLPERFDLSYIGPDGKPHRPVMIHRAPFGSLERMIGLLVEHFAGEFPFWYAPVQVAILPITDRHNAYAQAIAEALQGFPSRDRAAVDEEQVAFEAVTIAPSKPLRVEVDERRESLGRKIREAQGQKLPYMLIVGDRDAEAGTAGVRSREGDLGPMPLADVLEMLEREME